MICPKCGSENVNVQMVTDIKTKRRGCFAWFLWILLAVCTLGIVLIIPLLTNSKISSKQRKVMLCQNCGNSWDG